jgi:LacI family transcriptional regulator
MDANLSTKKVTIKDIAKMAGVSVSTVSNVINGTGRVSKRTADRVSEIIERINFNLNASARTLRQKTSRLITILVPREGENGDGDGSINPFYWEFVSGVRKVVEKQGFDVILKNISVTAALNLISERDLDGVIVLGAYEDSSLVEKITASNTPVVFVDSYLSNEKINVINLDDRLGSYLATRHLLGLGHRKIIFVSGKLRLNGVDYERARGFQDAMNESGEIVNSNVFFQTEVSVEAGRTLAHQLAYRINEFTGIVASADALALGLIRGFHECGISVPRQVSIVGFDDISYSSYTIPSITTIQQDVSEKGESAGRLLIDLINDGNGKGAHHVKLMPKLVVRESTAPPAAEK